MKKVLGKKVLSEAGQLVSYACNCWCYAPTCNCSNPANSQSSVDYAQEYANNVQNNSKLLVVHM